MLDLDLTSAIVDGVNESLDMMKTSVDEKTPEDEKELLSKNKITPAQINGTVVIWIVSNDADHSIYVEFGRNKLWKTNKYHKPKWSVFYTGIGARMYARTKLEKENEAKAIIQKHIAKKIAQFNRKRSWTT